LPRRASPRLASPRADVGARFSRAGSHREWVDTRSLGERTVCGMRLLHSRGALLRTYLHTCSSFLGVYIARLPLPEILTYDGREETEDLTTVNRAARD